MKILEQILSMRRPHGGINERSVAETILATLPLGLAVFSNAHNQPMAYLYVTATSSGTLFTSHLDTVHTDEATPNPVKFDSEKMKMWKEDGTPLGADDGAGVWLMYQMAQAGVPGTYLFTTGEEHFGVGARWVAECAESFLKGFDRAIAFDREGTSSVITHQRSTGRCCSDTFAEALAEELTRTSRDHGGINNKFAPDSTGIYTDTAEFAHLIPECTNISVGYAHRHSGKETLDVGFLLALRSAAIKVQWDKLPTERVLV